LYLKLRDDLLTVVMTALPVLPELGRAHFIDGFDTATLLWIASNEAAHA
jgi:hypothetical protein